MLLAAVAAASEQMAATPSRTGKAERLAQVLREAAPDEVAVVAAWLSGELRQRRTGIGWRSLRGLPPPAEQPTLAVREVDAAFAHLAGLARRGRPAGRARAGADARRHVCGPRRGVGASRRPGRGDWKLDGVRVQVHRDAARVRVLSRSLDDLTARMPEVVDVVRALPASRLVLDGEALAVGADGRPRPFQETAPRAGPGPVLTPWFVDVLHVDGTDLLDEPLSARAEALEACVPTEQRAPRLVTDDLDAARAFQAQALERGHEGACSRPSTRRTKPAGAAAWLEVKPRHTLDLVVLAVEHGSGRRRGWLSNLHLGARDPGGGFVMLGKTFKGLTDQLLAWQTARLRELATDDDGWLVRVHPELVVEVVFDGVQTSPRYPGGVALRFARVLRYQEAKRAEEADTIDDVRRLHRG